MFANLFFKTLWHGEIEMLCHSHLERKLSSFTVERRRRWKWESKLDPDLQFSPLEVKHMDWKYKYLALLLYYNSSVFVFPTLKFILNETTFFLI